MAVIDLYGLQDLADRQQLPAQTAVSSWSLDPVEQSQRNGEYLLTAGVYSAVTSNLPISESPWALSLLEKQWTFFDDYYYRIHIVPNPVYVGNLISEQQYEIEVWNAYLDASKTLEAITETSTDGVTLVGPAIPTTYLAGQSNFYDLTVGVEGPPDIYAIFGFDWSGIIDDADFLVIGTRIVGIPYRLAAPARETLEWRTDILPANDGTEQRIRLRKLARQTLAGAWHVPWGEMQAASNRLYGWHTRLWAVPMWTEAQRVATLSSGATSITIDTTTSDYREGGLVLIHETDRQWVIVEVETVAAGSLTLALPLGDDYVTPSVMPARIGRLATTPIRETNGANAAMRLVFEVIENIDLGAGTTPTQYLGYDFYSDEMLIDGSLEDSYQTRMDVVDYGLASRAEFFSPWTTPKLGRTWNFQQEGLADIWSFREWLHRRAGRLTPFWLPSFEADIRVLHTGSIIDTITVGGDGLSLFASGREHIGIQKTDGTWLLRRIISIADISAEEASIVLDSAIGLDASEIRLISFLGLKRLDTDRIEMEWNEGQWIRSSIPILEIEP
jgi:hypothetical protein